MPLPQAPVLAILAPTAARRCNCCERSRLLGLAPPRAPSCPARPRCTQGPPAGRWPLAGARQGGWAWRWRAGEPRPQGPGPAPALRSCLRRRGRRRPPRRARPWPGGRHAGGKGGTFVHSPARRSSCRPVQGSAHAAHAVPPAPHTAGSKAGGRPQQAIAGRTNAQKAGRHGRAWPPTVEEVSVDPMAASSPGGEAQSGSVSPAPASWAARARVKLREGAVSAASAWGGARGRDVGAGRHGQSGGAFEGCVADTTAPCSACRKASCNRLPSCGSPPAAPTRTGQRHQRGAAALAGAEGGGLGGGRGGRAAGLQGGGHGLGGGGRVEAEHRPQALRGSGQAVAREYENRG